LAAVLSLTGVLIFVVLWNGLGVFWPEPLVLVELKDGRKLLAERVETDANAQTGVRRVKFKTANREYGPQFQWVDEDAIRRETYPPDAFVLERTANLNYHGFLEQLVTPGLDVAADGSLQTRLAAALRAARAEYTDRVEPLKEEEDDISQAINRRVKYQKLDVEYRKSQLLRQSGEDSDELRELERRLKELEATEAELMSDSFRLSKERSAQEAKLRQNVAVFVDSAGRKKPIALLDIVRFYCPNRMGFFSKVGYYAAKVWELLSEDPREANQDGGLFPAIFGTVLMVFLMAILCFPLGVLAGIYLGEYAREGPLVRLVRIAVNNLAGIPSIVYGIFGLGFFIYLVGGTLDQWLFPARVDASEPVFGRGCILWASLTLGLLTIPVVIVSTEEALRAIPRGISEGSYALGATKFQTLCRVLLPMASPGMMTGFILAMARAAGEVAPLMITGAVKSAPVPMDGTFPYVHLDRQFMHLGFHIFDISCKSPNVEATKPMVYVTTLLLLLIVIAMTSTAIYFRNRMRKRFQLRAM
jgi:phosphate transport system permease protein